jgi:hypothetical protein
VVAIDPVGFQLPRDFVVHVSIAGRPGIIGSGGVRVQTDRQAKRQRRDPHEKAVQQATATSEHA